MMGIKIMGCKPLWHTDMQSESVTQWKPWQTKWLQPEVVWTPGKELLSSGSFEPFLQIIQDCSERQTLLMVVGPNTQALSIALDNHIKSF